MAANDLSWTQFVASVRVPLVTHMRGMIRGCFSATLDRVDVEASVLHVDTFLIQVRDCDCDP